MSETPIRIMLADDHPVILDGIRSQLTGLPDLTVVATAASFAEVLDHLTHRPIDILVLDLGNMGSSPMRLLGRLEREYPALKVVIFSTTIDLAPELLAAGARGYVAKEDRIGELVQAIRAVADGNSYTSVMVTAYVERRVTTEPLSPKELTVLKLFAQNLTREAVAAHMCIDPRSVQNYITTLRQKTGCIELTQLVDWYRRMYGDDGQEQSVGS